jgi:hypothetical protein
MRQLLWIKTSDLEAWGCSACGWTFSPSGPPQGSDLEEMKQNFERHGNQAHSFHVCAEHPRLLSAREDSKFSRRRDTRSYSTSPGYRMGQTELKRAI